MEVLPLLITLALVTAGCVAQDTPASDDPYVITKTATVMETVYVLATSTSSYSTTSCDASGCRSEGLSQPWSNSTSTLDTISLTSSGTSTVTSIVTPSDVTTTSYETSSSLPSTSTSFDLMNTFSTPISSISTTLPVLTLTIYPLNPTTTSLNIAEVSFGPPPHNFATAHNITIPPDSGRGPAFVPYYSPNANPLMASRSNIMAREQKATTTGGVSSNGPINTSRASTQSGTAGSFQVASSSANGLRPHKLLMLLTGMLPLASLSMARAAQDIHNSQGLQGRSWAIFSAPMGDVQPVASGVVLNADARGEIPDPQPSINAPPSEPTTTITQTSVQTATYTLVNADTPEPTAVGPASPSSTLTRYSTDMVTMTLDDPNDPRLHPSSVALPDTSTTIYFNTTGVANTATKTYAPPLPVDPPTPPTSTTTHTSTTLLAVTVTDPNDPRLTMQPSTSAPDSTITLSSTTILSVTVTDPNDPQLTEQSATPSEDPAQSMPSSSLKTPMPTSVGPSSCTWPSPNVDPGCVSPSGQTTVIETTIAPTTVTNMLTSTLTETMSPPPPVTVTTTAPPETMTATQVTTTTQTPSFSGPATSANGAERAIETGGAMLLVVLLGLALLCFDCMA